MPVERAQVDRAELLARRLDTGPNPLTASMGDRLAVRQAIQAIEKENSLPRR
jgi:hypothetical protein